MKKVYIYSRGEFNSLNPDFLKNKSIIRMHNVNDEKWYDKEHNDGIVLFFNDIKEHELSFWSKFSATFLNKRDAWFNQSDALKINSFIKKNLNKDFVIHCEYGKSRSVGVALFLNNNWGYHIENRRSHELRNANGWVIKLLQKYIF